MTHKKTTETLPTTVTLPELDPRDVETAQREVQRELRNVRSIRLLNALIEWYRATAGLLQ